MPTIYSTLTEPQQYTKYESAGDTHRVVASVRINGGHGKADHKTLITPLGMATEVTEEQLAILMENKSFLKHKERGYITVSGKREDAEKVAADMTVSDGSAQLTDADFVEDETKPIAMTPAPVQSRRGRKPKA